MKVASARDDGAIFAIAQNKRGDVAGYSVRPDSLNNGMSSIDVALSAGQSISDLLIQMKTKALSAADSSLDTASRQALNQDFTALRDQITTIVKNALFNGFNLVDGSTTQITLWPRPTARAASRSPAQNMSLSGTIVTVVDDGHDLDPGQGFDPGRHDPGVADQRQLGSWQAVGRCRRSSRSRRPSPRSCPTR